MRLVVEDWSINGVISKREGNEVNQAAQEKGKTIYQAREEYNKFIAQTRLKLYIVILSFADSLINYIRKGIRTYAYTHCY